MPSQYYDIKLGDTWEKIAQRYGMTKEVLLTANHIDQNNPLYDDLELDYPYDPGAHIYIGATIYIPDPTVSWSVKVDSPIPAIVTDSRPEIPFAPEKTEDIYWAWYTSSITTGVSTSLKEKSKASLQQELIDHIASLYKFSDISFMSGSPVPNEDSIRTALSDALNSGTMNLMQLAGLAQSIASAAKDNLYNNEGKLIADGSGKVVYVAKDDELIDETLHIVDGYIVNDIGVKIRKLTNDELEAVRNVYIPPVFGVRSNDPTGYDENKIFINAQWLKTPEMGFAQDEATETITKASRYQIALYIDQLRQQFLNWDAAGEKALLNSLKSEIDRILPNVVGLSTAGVSSKFTVYWQTMSSQYGKWFALKTILPSLEEEFANKLQGETMDKYVSALNLIMLLLATAGGMLEVPLLLEIANIGNAVVGIDSFIRHGNFLGLIALLPFLPEELLPNALKSLTKDLNLEEGFDEQLGAGRRTNWAAENVEPLCARMDETTSPSKFSIQLQGGEQDKSHVRSIRAQSRSLAESRAPSLHCRVQTADRG